jgi:dynein heavy chain
LDNCAELFDLMTEHEIPHNDSDKEGFLQLQPVLLSLRTTVDAQIANRDKIIEELMEQFRIETDQIFERIKVSRAIAEANEVLSPKSDAIHMAAGLKEVLDTLLADQEKAAKFNAYQKKLKIEVQDFDELDKLIVFTKYRHQLWDSIARWDEQRKVWDSTPFHELVHETMTREVNEYVKTVQQLEKALPPNEVVPLLKQRVEDIRAQLPWIANLHNPNIRPRHWEVMKKAMGINLTDENITLKELLDLGIENYVELIQETSAQASSEFSLEALLKKVEDSWQDVEFIVIPHKDQRDAYILGGTDEIQVLLDDSLIHMTTISSSRHVGPIKPKVDEWAKMLDLFSNTLVQYQILCN